MQIDALKEKFHNQLKSISEEIENLHNLISKLTTKREQIKGAIYALDCLSDNNQKETSDGKKSDT